MRIAAELSPDDHRNFVRSLPDGGNEEAKALESAEDLSGIRVSVCLMMAVFFGALVWVVHRWGMGGLLDRPFELTLIVIGLLAVPVAILWLMSVWRLRKDLKDVASGNIIDQNSLRNGLNIGEAYYDFDQDGMTVSLSLVQESYPWSAFQELQETPTAFHIMIDESTGLILPKRAFGDEAERQEFEAFVAERMGARG